MPSTPRELADRFHTEWLAANPFAATMYGLPGHDAEVPDASEAGDAAWRAQVDAVLAQAAELSPAALDAADAVTLACLVDSAERELLDLDSATGDHTVTAMPFAGPPVLLAVAARTLLVDAAAAADYVTRLRAGAGWLDQTTERLRSGAAKGRLPVARLVRQAIDWGTSVLAEPVPAAFTAAQPPAGWDGATAWAADRDAAVTEALRPALQRWIDLLGELLPLSRPDDRPGLSYLPGGEADYARAIQMHTTLPLTAEDLHRTGIDEIAQLEDRARTLGDQIGLTTLEEVRAALRASSVDVRPEDAIEAAVRAVRRAEARAGEVFPAPLPPPCEVAPMPSVVAASGMAPHYTPPRLDGARPGTYWFNTERATAGAGWDLEGVAFHEAVPGHHLQLSRLQLLTDLPAMQRQRSLTVFSEGWALYAEQLADEMGLYSDVQSKLGAVTASLMRAARLVVDTGLHHFGWSRQAAVDYFVEHVPMPIDFLVAEVDRYITAPGQALAYLTGKLELLRLRDDAQRQRGAEFSLPEFHSVVLDSGSLPMPVLHDVVGRWAAAG